MRHSVLWRLKDRLRPISTRMRGRSLASGILAIPAEHLSQTSYESYSRFAVCRRYVKSFVGRKSAGARKATQVLGGFKCIPYLHTRIHYVTQLRICPLVTILTMSSREIRLTTFMDILVLNIKSLRHWPNCLVRRCAARRRYP